MINDLRLEHTRYPSTIVMCYDDEDPQAQSSSSSLNPDGRTSCERGGPTSRGAVAFGQLCGYQQSPPPDLPRSGRQRVEHIGKWTFEWLVPGISWRDGLSGSWESWRSGFKGGLDQGNGERMIPFAPFSPPRQVCWFLRYYPIRFDTIVG
jgi:hypothetical protein